MEKTKDEPIIKWDVCEIAQAFVDDRSANSDIEHYQDMTDEEMFADIMQDSFFWEIEWDCTAVYLTEIMKEINPELTWTANVINFGWRNSNGSTDTFKAETGNELLAKILPETECTFHIYKRDYGFEIWNAHHDSPILGNEKYFVKKAG